MIKKNCFTKEWIQAKRKELGSVDPGLLEKTIYAFELLGHPCEKNLKLVFKGGTSLLLLLPRFNRLSIDIDILCDAPDKELNDIFDQALKDSPFERWEENPREPSGVPKKHFRFYFQSVVSNQENFVLLDILKGFDTFPKVKTLPIKHPVFEAEKKVSVKVPTLNGITGDKLTAFAPATIGIPYNEVRSMQIIKQLFDLGVLFGHVNSLKEVKESYLAFLATENGYRKQNYSDQETLQDTIDACYLICQSGFKGGVENEQTKILQNGIRRIGTHLINTNFRIDDARLSASKAALLATLLKHNSSVPAPLEPRFTPEKLEELKTLKLTGNYRILNRLKAILPEAFYYWHLISKLENEDGGDLS